MAMLQHGTLTADGRCSLGRPNKSIGVVSDDKENMPPAKVALSWLRLLNLFFLSSTAWMISYIDMEVGKKSTKKFGDNAAPQPAAVVSGVITAADLMSGANKLKPMKKVFHFVSLALVDEGIWLVATHPGATMQIQAKPKALQGTALMSMKIQEGVMARRNQADEEDETMSDWWYCQNVMHF
jgi:hypothetical protein